MAEGFTFMREAKKKHRTKIEPKRMEYALVALKEAGFTAEPIDEQSILVEGTITLWAFSGWYVGKGLKSGRGVHSLIQQLKQKNY